MNITDLTVDATVTWDDPADDGGPTGGVSIIANREPLWEVGVWRGSGTLATAIRASGGGWKWYNTSHSLTPGVEAQVRVTYDGTNIRTYVDGTLVDTTAHAKGGPVDGSTDEAMHVGRREARTSTRWYGTFGGTLSDVAIMDGVHPPP